MLYYKQMREWRNISIFFLSVTAHLWLPPQDAAVSKSAGDNFLASRSVSLDTVFTQSDAVATIYFIPQFCAAFIRKRCLLNSGREMKKSIASRKAEWLQMPGSQSEETLPHLPL